MKSDTKFKKLMWESETLKKRIRLSVWRNVNGHLVMHLQEFEVDGDFESFMMYSAWSMTVAAEKVPRCTEKAVAAFIEKYMPLARAAVADHVEVLMGGKPREGVVG